MVIHADDVVLAIRDGLKETSPKMSEIVYVGDGTTGWPNRDGKIWFECMGRDWVNGFRVTVEVINDPYEDGITWDPQTGKFDER